MSVDPILLRLGVRHKTPKGAKINTLVICLSINILSELLPNSLLTSK